MFKTGLVSISFRTISNAEIIEMVKMGGLEAIEWGGDIHVPHGDIIKASATKKLCEKNNILCPSYGSYYRVGEYENPEKEFKKVLDCSQILGSSVVRVWAGVLATVESDDIHFKKISNELKLLCDMADSLNIRIALEFHANTLTDNATDTLRLIKTVNKDNITTYWQPPVNRNREENLSDIDLLKGHISNIHTFTWEGKKRLELKDGYSDWVNYLGRINDTAERFCMLEFIKDDSVEGFYKDALTLRTLVNLFNL